MRKTIREFPQIEIRWHAFSAFGDRRLEAERGAREFLTGAKAAQIHVEDFRESYFHERGVHCIMTASERSAQSLGLRGKLFLDSRTCVG